MKPARFFKSVFFIVAGNLQYGGLFGKEGQPAISKEGMSIGTFELNQTGV